MWNMKSGNVKVNMHYCQFLGDLAQFEIDENLERFRNCQKFKL